MFCTQPAKWQRARRISEIAIGATLVLACAASHPKAPQAASESASQEAQKQPAMKTIQDYARQLQAVHSANPELKLAFTQDPSLHSERVLLVTYPAQNADPAGRDVWCDAEVQDWSPGSGLAFQVKADKAIKLSVSFQDRNHVAYTTWIPLSGGEWQRVELKFSELEPNPYFQPPNAKSGAPLDVSLVKRLGFAPVDEDGGQLSVGKWMLLP